METKNTGSVIPPDVLADLQLIVDCVAAGKPVPPEVARRVHERSERIRQEILEKHGVQDIGVQIIREMRGELPEA
jgi:hypothetical protein